MKTSILLSMVRMFHRLCLPLIIVALVSTTAPLTVERAEAASPLENISNAINAMDSKVDSINDMLSGLQLSVSIPRRKGESR